MIDAVGNVQRVLLLGGTSEIGLAVLRELAGGRPVHAVLAGRPGPRLDAAGSGLRAAGHDVTVLPFDAEDPASHPQVLERAFADGDVDVAVVAFGVLGDQERAWQDHEAAVRLTQVNFTASVSVGVELARHLSAQGRGGIIALSSVAGQRPRRSNFVYGATKAGMDDFYTGLREALRPAGVSVLVARPGFVRTRMTEGLPAAPLAVDQDAVARVVVRAWRAHRDVVYAPAVLRLVMVVLRSLPSPLFRRLPV
ncbi:decaprenylphospho-beta-D-erythro-pentofuranosid-2-ulose 2-reductase [Geodermatophilus dictyosporus]|uniref:Decaprenylphospho-beta-D-erythro-pentofuranosid-2-ulose 2-reductase n=1 Tax=Geodermatophilus dictyosporus TaxID=1523247 RepID=A0A1I5LZR2_9ACTN|nr:decaprenylphospho-beta-D-erythro-pentofuranosid-2-ulose 2-reductase [Geodermatophilus dictyosporus]SFP02241.1 decaprenylphospho-beta-D-erythro-pentofuranosid-2-ulose 2-reductase [Geodermatophilus dictyosporus]